MKDIKILKPKYDVFGSAYKLEKAALLNQSPIHGKSNLVQRVIKIMLTPIGTNFYYPELGTSINDILVGLTAQSKKADAQLLFAQVVSQTESFIKAEQGNFPELPASEQLDKIQIIDILYNEQTNAWKMKFSVINMEGTLSLVEI